MRTEQSQDGWHEHKRFPWWKCNKHASTDELQQHAKHSQPAATADARSEHEYEQYECQQHQPEQCCGNVQSKAAGRVRSAEEANEHLSEATGRDCAEIRADVHWHLRAAEHRDECAAKTIHRDEGETSREKGR